MLQPARGAYVAAMGPIASLRSLWTFQHIRRMGNPGLCGSRLFLVDLSAFRLVLVMCNVSVCRIGYRLCTLSLSLSLYAYARACAGPGQE